MCAGFCCSHNFQLHGGSPAGAPQEAGGHTVLGTPRHARPGPSAGQPSSQPGGCATGLCGAFPLPSWRKECSLSRTTGPLSPRHDDLGFPHCFAEAPPRLAGLVSPSLSPGSARQHISFVIKTKHQAVPRGALPASQLTGLRCGSGLVFPEASEPYGFQGGLTRVHVPHTQLSLWKPGSVLDLLAQAALTAGMAESPLSEAWPSRRLRGSQTRDPRCADHSRDKGRCERGAPGGPLSGDTKRGWTGAHQAEKRKKEQSHWQTWQGRSFGVQNEPDV